MILSMLQCRKQCLASLEGVARDILIDEDLEYRKTKTQLGFGGQQIIIMFRTQCAMVIAVQTLAFQ